MIFEQQDVVTLHMVHSIFLRARLDLVLYILSSVGIDDCKLEAHSLVAMQVGVQSIRRSIRMECLFCYKQLQLLIVQSIMRITCCKSIS